MHHGDTDQPQNCELRLLNTKLKAVGFLKGKYMGISVMYHIYADRRLGVGRLAVRKIPCACINCEAKLALPWVEGVPAQNQPKFSTVMNCLRSDILEGFNEWHICTFEKDKTGEGENTRYL